MNLFSSFFQKIKLDHTNQFKNSVEIPKYLPDMEWYQDSNQSIFTSDHKYDLTHFSQHESDTIEHVIKTVDNKYPLKIRSVGLANECCIIKYKPRYVLWEVLVQLYNASHNPVDKFACAIAYESKGALYRRDALNKFEECINYISPEFMQQFISLSPLRIYMMLSRLYEKEHEYDSAILYTKLAKKYGDIDNVNFDKRISELIETQSRNPCKRNHKPSKETLEFESDIESAAKYFITKFHLA